MKTTLVAVDAKYTHTNLAVRSIAAYARKNNIQHIDIAQFTINQRADFILSQLYAAQSDVYLFSCYIWNIELIRRVARELRKIHPRAKLCAGGPEVSFHCEAFLTDNPFFDLVVQGEGEESCTQLLHTLNSSGDITACPGITFWNGQAFTSNPPPASINLDLLAFPYGDLSTLQHRCIYLETMRGCPFRCSYCISSVEPGVRLRSLELVQGDLRLLLEAKVPRVKLVDRTFNCNRQRALDIWKYLVKHDNGVTNFHFELAGELLDDETVDFLSRVRPGLFQFEIGVQTTNPDTLHAIRRPVNTAKLFQRVEALRAAGNIHLHLDLIAGLPLEDCESFQRSFNQVYELRPHQLQLGFLKVLKGSPMEQDAKAFGILYQDASPYEVLQTRCLSYAELDKLKSVEALVDLYYNSGRFSLLLRELCGRFSSPFDLYLAMSALWNSLGYSVVPPDKIGHYDFLACFMRHHNIPITTREQWLCKYDLCLREPPRRLPKWIEVDGVGPYQKAFAEFFRNSDGCNPYLPLTENFRQAAKQSHLERFPFDPVTGEQKPVFLLFDYSRRDMLGQARVQHLPDFLFD